MAQPKLPNAGGRTAAEQREDFARALEEEQRGLEQRIEGETDAETKKRLQSRLSDVKASAKGLDKAETASKGVMQNRGGTGDNAHILDAQHRD